MDAQRGLAGRGGRGGPHSFDFSLGLGLQPDGGVVHLDWKAERLYFLDAKGQPLRTVGREGSGPGEFRMPTGLVVLPDGGVIVRDLQNGFIHFRPGRLHRGQAPPPGSFRPVVPGMPPPSATGACSKVLRLNPSQNRGREHVRLLWNRPGEER